MIVIWVLLLVVAPTLLLMLWEQLDLPPALGGLVISLSCVLVTFLILLITGAIR